MYDVNAKHLYMTLSTFFVNSTILKQKNLALSDQKITLMACIQSRNQSRLRKKDRHEEITYSLKNPDI